MRKDLMNNFGILKNGSAGLLKSDLKEIKIGSIVEFVTAARISGLGIHWVTDRLVEHGHPEMTYLKDVSC